MDPFRINAACRNRQAVVLAALVGLVALFGVVAGALAGDWPLYSHDYNNSNFNPEETEFTGKDLPFLRRAWETFNDDTLVNEPIPTGFILEEALGLKFPSPVVGVIASPIVRDGTLPRR